MSQTVTKKKSIRITVESTPSNIDSRKSNDQTADTTVTAEGAARRRRRLS